MSSEEILCVTPSLEVGSVEVSVSNNGIDFSPSSLTYEGEADVTISEIWPTRSSTAGRLLCHGARKWFANSSLLECQFGGVPASETTFLSGNVVRCVAPVHAEDTVNVEVSNNGVDFTSAGTYFNSSPTLP